MKKELITIPPDLVRHNTVFSMADVPEPWSIPKEIFQPIWDAGITGKGFTVAIVDTGGSRHPQLPVPIFARNYTTTNANDWTDRDGHGSHCAGSAIGRDGIGVAPGANLAVLKVLNDNGAGASSWIRKGTIDAAVLGKADIISRSLGGGCAGGNEAREDIYAMNKAYAAGASLIVDAAGNAGYNGRNTIGCPGKYMEGFCIGATKKSGEIANFSSGGREIDVATPGERIPSVRHTGGFTEMSGTSMATPFFAGLMALVLHARRRIGMPDMRGADAWRNFFRSNNLLIDAGADGRDVRFGDGIPDINKIIDWLKGTIWA